MRDFEAQLESGTHWPIEAHAVVSARADGGQAMC